MCIHVSSNVWCVVLCCKFNATGNLLGSDPGALGHCKSFTLPWCSRHTARSHTLWHANTWKLRVISNMCLSDMPRGVTCISTGCVQAARKEEWRREAEGSRKTALPRCRHSPETTAPSLFALIVRATHTPPRLTTTQPCLIPQHLMRVFRQRAVRLIFRNIWTLPADPSRSLRFKGNKCKI